MFKLYSPSEDKVKLFKDLCVGLNGNIPIWIKPQWMLHHSCNFAPLVAKSFIIDGNVVNEPANPQWGKRPHENTSFHMLGEPFMTSHGFPAASLYPSTIVVDKDLFQVKILRAEIRSK